MGIPSSLAAGDTWSWSESLPEYSAAAGWSLSYSLLPVSGTGTKLTVSATPSGSDFAVSVAAATTALYAAGEYQSYARVSKAGEVHTLPPVRLTVLPDSAAAIAYDSRSTAAKALAKIDAWLAGDRSLDVAQHVIGDSQIQFHPLPALIILRDRLKMEVANEAARQKLAAGLGADPRNIFVRFGMP